MGSAADMGAVKGIRSGYGCSEKTAIKSINHWLAGNARQKKEKMKKRYLPNRIVNELVGVTRAGPGGVELRGLVARCAGAGSEAERGGRARRSALDVVAINARPSVVPYQVDPEGVVHVVFALVAIFAEPLGRSGRTVIAAEPSQESLQQGALRLCRGAAWHLWKLTKLHWFIVFPILIRGAWSTVWRGAEPTKTPRGDVTVLQAVDCELAHRQSEVFVFFTKLVII